MPRHKRDTNVKLKDAYSEIRVYRDYIRRAMNTLKKVNQDVNMNVRVVRRAGNLAVLSLEVEKEVLILSRDIEAALAAYKEQT